MAKSVNSDKLVRLLMRGPATSPAVVEELGISQPTFSRVWTTIKDGLALGAGRRRHYALRRSLQGVDAPVPVLCIGDDGLASPIGQLQPLQGGFYALTQPDTSAFRLFQGMPFFLRDLRPQGFLGRMEPGRHRDLELPADILLWTDEQTLKYIARRSEHAVGNLILGNESYARHIADGAQLPKALVLDSDRLARYPDMATHSMQGEPPGSSAGGEQPKFTAVIQRGAHPDTAEHVIVKFSPGVDTPSGRRWADMLICEHLALEVLARNGIAAARTAILESGNRVFLEVVRFDRVGLKGRLPMATFSALDGDLGMMDQNWTTVARELGRLGQLSREDTATVEILDLYGSLIGNTDKHHGNIAVAWTFDKPHRLLEAYDMLPMLYRPNAHGEIIARTWMPQLGAKLELRHLPLCYRMAVEFWDDVLNNPLVSDAFKQDIASRHLTTLRSLNPG